MTVFDDIRKDREAGTPGPWEIYWRKDGSSIIRLGISHIDGLPSMQADFPFHKDSEKDVIDARRIARVPELEAIALAAEATSDPEFLFGAMDNVHDMDVTLKDYAEAASRAIRGALSAYRKAVEQSK